MWSYIICFAVISVVSVLKPWRRRANFKGKNVVITGGSTGIGRSIAVRMCKEGANVIVLARTQKTLDETLKEMKKYSTPSQKLLSMTCDVADRQSVQDTIDKCVETNGSVDYLICCAGLSTPGYFLEQELDIHEHTMKVDYFGTLYATKAVSPYMVKQGGGHIVFTGSLLSSYGMIGFSTYCPAKFALRGLAESLRNELAPYNIKISIAYPPDTDTPGFERENTTKPIETKEISALGTTYSPDHVGNEIVNGLAIGEFHLAADLITRLVIANGNGVQPRQYGIAEIAVLPILAVVGSVISLINDNIVYKHYKLRKNKKE